jgi:predicted nucleic acid-binding protein
MPSVVIDTSAVLAVLLHEPQRPALIGLTREATLLAPGSVPWEVGNGLIAGFRRGRLTARDVHDGWLSFEGIPLRLVEVRIARALTLAQQYGLYAYDAYVLELARAQRAPLLTLDRRLLDAAADLGIEPLEVNE